MSLETKLQIRDMIEAKEETIDISDEFEDVFYYQIKPVMNVHRHSKLDYEIDRILSA